MPSGAVKWFNPTKGYGFIQPDGGGHKDVFVHISAFEKAGFTSLAEGAKVTYDIVVTRKGERGKSAGAVKTRQAGVPPRGFLSLMGLDRASFRGTLVKARIRFLPG
jgi:CspA family cold shock protein